LARPQTILYVDAITLDGNLTEWTGAEWAPLDQIYSIDAGGASRLNEDIPEAYYAAKWGPDNRLYVAVRVKDLHHVYTDTYEEYNTRDAVEIYVHTTGSELNNYYYATQASAQQYSVGIKAGDNTAVWTDIGYKKGLPVEANFNAAGKVDGQWLCYEVALTPYEVFSLTGQGLVVSPLSAGQAVGLDVVAIANDNPTDRSLGSCGTKSENMLPAKFQYYNNFGLHRLGSIPSYTGTDLTAMLAAMDSTPGEENWSAPMDLNNDGEISSTDLSILLTRSAQ
jgi:hypothetical protein